MMDTPASASKSFIVVALASFLLGFFSFAFSAHASAPLIYSYTVSSGNPTATQAVITWTTNVAATSSVSYGLTTGYGTASSSATLVNAHSVTLTGLTPNTTYHFQVGSQDGSGNVSYSSDYTFTTSVQCTYYVDSVSGSDSNSGTDAGTPFRHLSTVPAVSNGATICLRRGSTFTDSLYVGVIASPVNNVTVRDYGPANLAMPMIDNSDVIAPTAWSLVAGTSQLYQATVPGPGTSTSTPYGTFNQPSIYINVFECKSAPCTPAGLGGNDNFLQTVNTQALASSTAGSYFIAGENGIVGPTTPASFTIYMHTTDGTSPSSNGYTYSYSNRFSGVQIAGLNATVSNIASKKSSSNSGNIVQNVDAGSATFNNIEADQGGKHNAFCSGGCVVNNSKFVDEYYPGSGNMFVAFDGTGAGATVTLNNNTFLNGVSTVGNAVTSVYAHVGAGTTFSNFIVNGGLVETIGGGYWQDGVSASSQRITVTGLTCNNVANECVASSGTTTVSNTRNYAPALASALVNIQSGNTDIIVASSTLCSPLTYAHAAVHNQSNVNVRISVATSTFYVPANGAAGVNDLGTGGGFMRLFNTIIDSNQSNAWVNTAAPTSTEPYTADYNYFVLPSMIAGAINNIGYTGLTAWRAATGQDIHTVSTSPTPNAQTISCSAPAISFTGPSGGSINTASGNFTVTPGIAYDGSGGRIGFIGTVTLTPSGTASAALAPVTLTFTAAGSTTPQTFSITPTATGTLTLSQSANGSTISPAFLASTTLTYTVNSTVPSAPYGTPTAVAGNTTATVSFYAPADIGGSGITGYTVTSNPAGGTDLNAGTASLTHSVIGLTNGTSYTFTVTATNAAGTSPASSASNSVTPITVPTVSTQAPAAVTTTAGTGNGNITTTGGASPTVRGMVYGTTVAYGATTTENGSFSAGSFTEALTGLVCNTAYHLAAYATNTGGTGYGNDQTFTTSACPVTQAAVGAGNGAPGSVGVGNLNLPPPRPQIVYPDGHIVYLDQPSTTSPAVAPSAGTPTPSVSTASAASFTRDLKRYDRGADVLRLQQYLNGHGFTIATNGPGSPGHETSRFGILTYQALKRFQKSVGIRPTGYLGPVTRRYIGGH